MKHHILSPNQLNQLRALNLSVDEIDEIEEEFYQDIEEDRKKGKYRLGEAVLFDILVSCYKYC